MLYDVNYAKEFTIRGETEDYWFWRTVEADNEEHAMQKVREERNAKYIISVSVKE